MRPERRIVVRKVVILNSHNTWSHRIDPLDRRVVISVAFALAHVEIETATMH